MSSKSKPHFAPQLPVLRGLTLQLLVIIILPVTILLLIVTFGSLSLHYKAMQTLVGTRDTRAAQAAASAISQGITHRIALLESMAIQANDAAYIREVLSTSSTFLSSHFQELAFFLADGSLLASNDDALWNQIQSGDAFLNSDSQISFSSFASGQASQKLILATASSPNGIIAAGAFSPAALVEALPGQPFYSEGFSIIIIDANANVLFGSETSSPIDSLDRSHSISLALKGEAGVVYADHGSEDFIIAYAPIPPFGWALILEEPWQAVASPLLRTTQVAPLVLVPVLLLALVALIFVAHQIVQPLQALEAQTKVLSGGQYQAIEKPVGGIPEIRHLQSELILMAQKLRAAQDSLHRYIGAITTSQEEERRRLARELHDDTLQALIALNQRIQLAHLSSRPEEGETNSLEEIHSLTEQTIQNLRRVTKALRPIYLEDLGLAAALEMIAHETSSSLNIPVSFNLEGEERRLAPEVELALYRIAQEALSNIARHAKAERAALNISFNPTNIRLSVSDDGCGFSLPENPAVYAQGGHFGLLGLYERAELIGASLKIYSSPGEGSLLQINLPSAAEKAG